MAEQGRIEILYDRYPDRESLSDEDQLLLTAADEICAKAYAPYSRFQVGAALRIRGIEGIFSGNNQENVAYPSGLCAERVALFHAMAEHPGSSVESIAIVAKSALFSVDSPITPCGSCRQALLEYERISGKKTRVIMAGEAGEVLIFHAVTDLLPFSFFEVRLGKA